jgi:hypothetical protein
MTSEDSYTIGTYIMVYHDVVDYDDGDDESLYNELINPVFSPILSQVTLKLLCETEPSAALRACNLYYRY